MIEVRWICDCGTHNTEYFGDSRGLCFSFIPADSRETQEIRRTESFVVSCDCGRTYEIRLKGEIEPIDENEED